jgi:predicted GIY-YIG superfamily endonuclease
VSAAAEDPAGAPPGPGEVVYLLHLDPPYRHARHYTGTTRDLPARLQAHREGRGGRLMEVVKQAGGSFRLARTWPGGRDRERAIKDRHEAPRLCPECSARPKPVEAGRAAARTAADTQATPALPAPVPVDPYTRGTEMAGLFMRAQIAAGRSAEQIAATRDYITGPWREASHHTAAQTETYRGYTDVIAQQLAQLRDAVRVPEAGRGDWELGA